MAYSSLKEALIDLEKNGHLVRIKEEVDPYLEMAAIHLNMYAKKGPALWFEKVKGSKYSACSNIFGSLDRSRFIFRNTWDHVQNMIALKSNPLQAIKQPLKSFATIVAGRNALPLKNPSKQAIFYEQIKISDLPQIQHWPMDGGAFVTLPQVYSEDIDKPGILNANLGMYRIQLSGNDYIQDKEIGLHYQLHRGIGVHQTKANAQNKALKVSCFVGGPPAHTLAAVMPLPESMSEMTFAGALAGRRFRYRYLEGYCISTDADFVICGSVAPKQNKPEGPFGDHLGYYSLKHDFPLMQVAQVWARKDAVWPFTVVGRPPQEDTSFGQLIHELSGQALVSEIPGLKEVNAVDAAGVHPLLLCIGSERYTPYSELDQPAELLTIANHILGTGQLSLAKFIWITAPNHEPLSTHNIEHYFTHVLERIDWRRDLHFYTQTTIDTLDYSGQGLTSGSKVVLAAYGSIKRKLQNHIPQKLLNYFNSNQLQVVAPGILAFELSTFENYEKATAEMETLSLAFKDSNLEEAFPLWICCDNAAFLAQNLSNFLWNTFTRANPAYDIYGIDAFTTYKHWGCNGPLIIDARAKPHHAPPLVLDPKVEENIQRLWKPGASLYAYR